MRLKYVSQNPWRLVDFHPGFPGYLNDEQAALKGQVLENRLFDPSCTLTWLA